jgi:hypothetical protein
VQSNKLRCNGGAFTRQAYYLPVVPGDANQTASVVFTQTAADNERCYAGVRMSTAAQTGYFGGYLGTSKVNLYKWVAGSITELGQMGCSISAGNDVLLEVNANVSTISLFVQRVSDGQWLVSANTFQVSRVACLSFTDTDITAAGRVGIWVESLSGTAFDVDSFSAADGSSPPDTTPPSLTSGSAAGGTLTGTGGVTSNEAGTLYWQVNGSATALTYPGTGAMTGWTSRSMTASAQTWSLGTLAAGTYYLHLVAEDAVPNRTTTDLVLGPFTVAAGGTAPSITVQPTNQTVTAPAAATFSVTATGTGSLTYQWRRNGTNIGGATSSSYTTPATTVTGGSANDGDLYSVVVTGDTSPPATSSNATLTVNAPGVTYGFSVGPFGLNTGSGSLLGVPVSYTLTPGEVGAASGASINGTGTFHATTGVLTVSGLAAPGVYSVQIKNADGTGRWHDVRTAV